MAGTHIGAVVKNCSSWEGLPLKDCVEDWLLLEGSHTGTGDECEESFSKREGVAETTCDEQSADNIPFFPVLLHGRRKRYMKLSSRRLEG